MNIHDAFHKTVHSYPGGAEALAVRMGMKPGVLRNKANPNADYHVPTLADADRVMALSEDHAILHALATNHGYVCVKVAEDVEGSDKGRALVELLMQIWSDQGRVGQAINEALVDGRIEKHEAETVKDLVFKADRALHELVARFESMATGKRG